jgi:hypothetical protein
MSGCELYNGVTVAFAQAGQSVEKFDAWITASLAYIHHVNPTGKPQVQAIAFITKEVSADD